MSEPGNGEVIERPKGVANWPIISKIFSTIDENVREHGRQQAMKSVLDSLGVKFQAEMDKKTEEVLKTKPCIVVFNHPYKLEPFVLMASLPERPDISFLSMAEYFNLVPNLDKYLIPAHIYHNAKDMLEKIFLTVFHKIQLKPELSAYKEGKINWFSLKEAARKIDSGGLILIAPKPGPAALKKGEWYSGVGHLVTDINDKDSTYYVNAFIDGTSHWDWLRLLPIRSLRRKLPDIKLHFSSPQPVSTIVSAESTPKEVTRKLKFEYNEWQNSLKAKIN